MYIVSGNTEMKGKNMQVKLLKEVHELSNLPIHALPFAASADFAFHKDGGNPCPNLQPDFRCGIHQDLRQKGFRGCAVYECFGTGQKLSQVTFGGNNWRDESEPKLSCNLTWAAHRADINVLLLRTSELVRAE